MAQRLTTSSVNTNIPGAYVETTVKSTPVGITNTGDIVIIGEASGGADFSTETLKENFFTATQLDRVRAKYISGPIVDAMAALTAPSNDSAITGSAGRVYIVKTNAGSQASATVATAYGTLTDKNYGLDGNKYAYQVSQVDAEVAPSITGTALAYAGIAEVTQIVADSRSNSADGEYIDIDSQAGVLYRFYLDTTGGDATIPAAGGRTLVQVDISGAADTAAGSGDALAAIINAQTDLTCPSTGTGTILCTDDNAGDVTDADDTGIPTGAWAVTTTVQGDDADGSIFDGLSFTVREDGKAADVITLSGTEGSHDTLLELAAEITALFLASTSSKDMEAAVSGSQLIIRRIAATNNAANAIGHGKSFELVDSTPGDLLALGHAAGLVVSATEPEVQVAITRQDTNTNEAHNVNAEVALSIGYVGTSATLSISSGVLTTTVVGGTGANLSITLSEHTTMSDLAAFIATQTGYSASSIASSNNLAPIRLDEVTTLGICSTASVESGRIKKAAYNFALKLSESSTLDMAFTASLGLPNEMASKEFLSGGAKGSTLAADIVSALSPVEGIKVNFVVPLFSRDASEDIAEGLTDSASTYTIDAINALVKSHCLAMSTIKLKKNRLAMLSKWGTFASVKTAAQGFASFRALLFSQRSSQVNSVGVTVDYLPWHTAIIATGMQSAGFYKSLAGKGANVVSFTDPSGFDSGNFGDTEEATDAGLMILQSDTDGSRWIVDQTTYGFDTNFVYNSLQAMYMADVLSVQLADFLGKFIVGKSLADVGAAAIAGQIAKKMEEFRKLKVIGASDDAPLGYKGLDININGPIAEVKIEAKLATAILFIPVQLELSQIQSSTSA